MLENFYPEEFFSLEDFRFKEVFFQQEPCWATLKNLSSFFQKSLLGKIEIDIPDHVYLVNPELISIGCGTTIEPGAYIEGPCIIGRHVEIRHMSYIRAYSLVGDHAVIGHASEIKHSILLNHAKAPHFNYVGDSIVGAHVNLGAGVVCANVTLHQKEIMIKHLGQVIPTHLKKFGAIIGDHSSLGCHTVTNPGTFLKKRFLSRPGEIVYGCNLNQKTKITL